jgi:hypothetical protein
MKKLSFLVIIFSILFFACNSKDQRVIEAENMINDLDSVKTEMQAVDSSEIALKSQSYMANIEAIQSVFNDTNHTDEEWELLTQYSTIKKPLRDYSKKYSIFMKELNYSITQIESLIYEYEEGSIDSVKYDSYYQTEMEVANNLMLQIQVELAKTKESSNKYDSLNPQIEKYIEEKKLND